jgi:hypothetical protein
MEGGRKMNPTLVLALRCLVGGLFLYAGAIKAWNPAGFFTDIQNYRLLPHTAAAALALYLPWLELIGGGCVLLRRYYAGALAILLGLVVLFIAALACAWARGLDIACGCFGSADGTQRYPLYLIRDLAILAAIAVLARRRDRTPL